MKSYQKDTLTLIDTDKWLTRIAFSFFCRKKQPILARGRQVPNTWEPATEQPQIRKCTKTEQTHSPLRSGQSLLRATFLLCQTVSTMSYTSYPLNHASTFDLEC